MIINTDELRLFKILYDTQSLSDTSVRLNISISKASRLLGSLRQTFGDRLFIRCDHRMCPTMRAKELQPKIFSLLHDFDELEVTREFTAGDIDRLFSIGGLDKALVSFIGPLLPELRTRAPNIRLNFHQLTPDFYSDLHQGKIDLAFYATTESYPGFHRLQLCEDYYVYVTNSSSDLAQRIELGESICEREIKSHLSVQLTLPKLSADDSGELPFIDRISNAGSTPFLSIPYFVTAPLLLNDNETALIPYQTASVLANRIGLTILGRSKNAVSFYPSLLWSKHVDADPTHQWLRSFFYTEIHTRAADVRLVSVLPP